MHPLSGKISNREIELAEFISEMNDLIEKGILRQASDFQLWLEDVQGECRLCYHDLTGIVHKYMEYL